MIWGNGHESKESKHLTSYDSINDIDLKTCQQITIILYPGAVKTFSFFFWARIVFHILNMVFNLYQWDLLPLMLATPPSLYLFCQTLASSTCPINSTTVSVRRPCLRSRVLIFIQAGFHLSKWRVVTSVSASYQQQNVQFSSALALMLTWPQCQWN